MDDELYSRNWAFIDEATQTKLSRTTLLTAGTGLGSAVATLAARTGFGRFILADGDRVELSNLNRQAFFRRQIGQNKAVATAELIREISDDAAIETILEFLTEATLAAPIARSDIVVNTIDFDDPVFLACNRIARQAGRVVLLPLNLGFGSALYVFTPASPTLEDILAAEIEQGGIDAIKTALVLRAVGSRTQAYMKATIAKFLDPGPRGWPYDPQLGIATSVAAALTVGAAVAWTEGRQLRTFPDFAALDVWPSVVRPEGRGDE